MINAYSTLFTLPTMPSIYDIHDVETLFVQHLQTADVNMALIVVVCCIVTQYLRRDNSSVTNKLVLGACLVYVESMWMIQSTYHSDGVFRTAVLVYQLVVIYTSLRQAGPDHDRKLNSVAYTMLVASLVSWLFAPCLQDHAFSAMWRSTDWQNMLGFVEECMHTTYAYCMETIFLDRKFIKQWFQTMFQSVAEVAVALVVLICVVLMGRDFETQNKHNCDTQQAALLDRDRIIQQRDTDVEQFKIMIDHLNTSSVEAHNERDACVKHYKGLTQGLNTAWTKAREEKRAVTERNAELLSEVAEAADSIVDRDCIIEQRETDVEQLKIVIDLFNTSSVEACEDNCALTERNAVLLSEVTKAAASIEERGRKIQELEAIIQKHVATNEEQKATIEVHGTTIQKQKATIQERDRTLKESNHTIKEYEQLQDELEIETREDNRISAERYDVLRTDLAEANACNAMLQSVLTEAVADIAVVTERIAVLQTEAAEAAGQGA